MDSVDDPSILTLIDYFIEIWNIYIKYIKRNLQECYIQEYDILNHCDPILIVADDKIASLIRNPQYISRYDKLNDINNITKKLYEKIQICKQKPESVSSFSSIEHIICYRAYMAAGILLFLTKTATYTEGDIFFQVWWSAYKIKMALRHATELPENVNHKNKVELKTEISSIKDLLKKNFTDGMEELSKSERFYRNQFNRILQGCKVCFKENNKLRLIFIKKYFDDIENIDDFPMCYRILKRDGIEDVVGYYYYNDDGNYVDVMNNEFYANMDIDHIKNVIVTTSLQRYLFHEKPFFRFYPRLLLLHFRKTPFKLPSAQHNREIMKLRENMQDAIHSYQMIIIHVKILYGKLDDYLENDDTKQYTKDCVFALHENKAIPSHTNEVEEKIHGYIMQLLNFMDSKDDTIKLFTRRWIYEFIIYEQDEGNISVDDDQ